MVCETYIKKKKRKTKENDDRRVYRRGVLVSARGGGLREGKLHGKAPDFHPVVWVQFSERKLRFGGLYLVRFPGCPKIPRTRVFL
ncbi:MAG: hypothetical protein R6U96_16155 [Promethearchaeia archaeon]